MKNRYLVTGATGFVGSNITRFLLSRGEDVSILVRNKLLNWRLRDSIDKVTIYESDLQGKELGNILDVCRPTIVIHTAAYGALPQHDANSHEIFQTNLYGLVNLLQTIKKQKIHRFINTGSSSEYGIKDHPMKESDILVPINDYGVSKAAATLYAQKEALIDLLPVVTLRLFSPYGYYDDPSRLIPYTIYQALKNKPIKLNSPTNVRDFLFIEDVIKAYTLAESGAVSSGEVFNVGSGTQHTVKEIVEMIMSITHSRSEVLWGERSPQKRQIEPSVWRADLQHVTEGLHWEPQTSIIEGISKTIQWIKENGSYYEKS